VAGRTESPFKPNCYIIVKLEVAATSFNALILARGGRKMGKGVQTQWLWPAYECESHHVARFPDKNHIKLVWGGGEEVILLPDSVGVKEVVGHHVICMERNLDLSQKDRKCI
jgi:hypothetical protein